MRITNITTISGVTSREASSFSWLVSCGKFALAAESRSVPLLQSKNLKKSCKIMILYTHSYNVHVVVQFLTCGLLLLEPVQKF